MAYSAVELLGLEGRGHTLTPCHGDREHAMSLLDESLAISNELGMRPLVERVLESLLVAGY